MENIILAQLIKKLADSINYVNDKSGAWNCVIELCGSGQGPPCCCECNNLSHISQNGKEFVWLSDSSLLSAGFRVWGVSFPAWPISASPTLCEFVLDFQKVVITAVICLAPVIDCYTSTRGGIRRNVGRASGGALDRGVWSRYTKAPTPTPTPRFLKHPTPTPS
jgi:hypothetical protein